MVQISSETVMLNISQTSSESAFASDLADQHEGDEHAVDRQRLHQRQRNDERAADAAGGLGLTGDGVHGLAGREALGGGGRHGGDDQHERGRDCDSSGCHSVFLL